MRLALSNDEEAKIVSITEALKAAEEAGLDLVEVAPMAKPPVCRLMDFSHFIYEEKKKRAAARKKQKRVQVKEIKLRPVTEEADLMVKLRNGLRFLDNGDKIKVSLRFRGREMSHQEIGLRLLQRFQQEVGDAGIVEQEPKLEGRQIIMVIAPARTKK
ncbi:MAG: translation initiation factor IF-3 [marine bacterium B5-7]|nr:MAG: translation initiation factor IF-3 [marine bacterium B5-7]